MQKRYEITYKTWGGEHNMYVTFATDGDLAVKCLMGSKYGPTIKAIVTCKIGTYSAVG